MVGVEVHPQEITEKLGRVNILIILAAYKIHLAVVRNCNSYKDLRETDNIYSRNEAIKVKKFSIEGLLEKIDRNF